jgi:hypothetical protein
VAGALALTATRKTLSNDNEQHLNAGSQSLTDVSDEAGSGSPSRTPYKNLKEVFQALATTGLPFDSVIKYPDGRIEIRSKDCRSSESAHDLRSESSAAIDKAFN